MGMFEQVATAQLKVLFMLLLLGNVFRAIPANTAKACGMDLYVRFDLTRFFLLLTAVLAAVLLLHLRVILRFAEASRAWAAGAHHEPVFTLGSVGVGWMRRSLRAMLLVAVALSFAASVLAVAAFQDGFLYRTGCDAEAYHAGHGAGSPLSVLMIGLFALLHGFFAWVAVSQN